MCVAARVGVKEGNVLFNDALNTFYFTVIWRRIVGVRCSSVVESLLMV